MGAAVAWDVTESPCRLTPAFDPLRIAWTTIVGDDPAQLRSITVYLGGDDVLNPVLRASDARSAWADADVCPVDLTADGLVDLLFTYRLAAAPDLLHVEFVAVATQPSRVYGLAPLSASLAEGEGCSAAVLDHVVFDPSTDRLTLVDPPRTESTG